MLGFDDLPDETIIEILSYLSAADDDASVASLARTAKRYQRITNDQILWSEALKYITGYQLLAGESSRDLYKKIQQLKHNKLKLILIYYAHEIEKENDPEIQKLYQLIINTPALNNQLEELISDTDINRIINRIVNDFQYNFKSKRYRVFLYRLIDDISEVSNIKLRNEMQQLILDDIKLFEQISEIQLGILFENDECLRRILQTPNLLTATKKITNDNKFYYNLFRSCLSFDNNHKIYIHSDDLPRLKTIYASLQQIAKRRNFQSIYSVSDHMWIKEFIENYLDYQLSHFLMHYPDNRINKAIPLVLCCVFEIESKINLFPSSLNDALKDIKPLPGPTVSYLLSSALFCTQHYSLQYSISDYARIVILAKLDKLNGVDTLLKGKIQLLIQLNDKLNNYKLGLFIRVNFELLKIPCEVAEFIAKLCFKVSPGSFKVQVATDIILFFVSILTVITLFPSIIVFETGLLLATPIYDLLAGRPAINNLERQIEVEISQLIDNNLLEDEELSVNIQNSNNKNKFTLLDQLRQQPPSKQARQLPAENPAVNATQANLSLERFSSFRK